MWFASTGIERSEMIFKPYRELQKCCPRDQGRVRDKSEEFRQQLQSFRKFKERMVEAGVYRENRYTIPLMHRLG